MSFANILPRITVPGYSAGSSFYDLVIQTLETIYNGSPLAAQAMVAWLNSNPTQDIEVRFVAGKAQAFAGLGIIEIDPAFFATNYYMSTTGHMVRDTFLSGFAHELGHAITGLKDNETFANLAGANVQLTNKWYQQLGIEEQVTYSAYVRSATVIDVTKQFTNGSTVANAIIDQGTTYTNSLNGFSFDPGNVDLTSEGVRGSTLMVGQDRSNNYKGTKDRDWIYGNGGNDILDGGDGNDFVYGGDDDDTLEGGLGKDELHGEKGADILRGGAGDDKFFADADDIELDGGLGFDKVDYHESAVAIDWTSVAAQISGIEEIIGSDFGDVLEMPTSVAGQILDSDLIIDGGKGDDKIRGTELANELRGGEGDDTIYGLGGADTIEGGDGDDHLIGGDESYALWPDNDEIRGGAGDDTISGGDGADKLWGGADNDGMLGGKGKDQLHGDDGDDLLAGGEGDDNLYGDAGKDGLVGDAGIDHLFGGADNDTLTGGEGDDDLYGDAGNDGLVGDAGNDHLFGGIGNDTLVGGVGEDTLNGEGGNDILDASQGDSSVDILKGEGGSDTFIVNSGDKIIDLEKSDKIILGGQLMTGGEKKDGPPPNPCNNQTPPQPEDDDGTYKGSNGAIYELSGSTLTISFGGQSIVLDHFRNGDGGINLRPDRSRQDQAECKRDPLILDLNGDRDVYDKLADSSAYFDLDNDGFAEHVAWAQKGDGFLVFDRNANGLIDDGTELFGSNYVQRTGGTQHEIGENGFADLTRLDTNFDYLITAADADFAKLQVWIDANGDGLTEDGELKTLAELGIVSISLNSRTSDAEVCGCDGTTVPMMSDVLRADGTSVRIYDAYLAIDQYDTRETNPIEVPAEFRDLPFLIGSGTLSDLDVAMAKDPALEQLVREFAGLDASRASEIPELVEQIVLRWTGADTVAADSRGYAINAQWLTALEKLSGSEFFQAAVGPNPRGDAASILIDDWDAIINRFTAELLGQTSLGAELMPGLEFAGAASFQAVAGTSLSSVIDSLVAHAPSGPVGDQAKYWHAMTATLTKYSRDLAVTEAEVYAAIDAVPAVQALGLSASQLANLSITDEVTGRNIGTGRMGIVATGADVLFADVANAELKGFDGNDVYVLTSEATGTTLADTNGFDRLVLIDQNRDSITATAIIDSSWNDRIVITLTNETTGWTLDLGGRFAMGMLVLDIDTIDFADLKGVPVVDLLPAEIYTPSGQRIYYGSNQDVSLLGSAGDDLIIGTGTADRYRLNATSGHDKINDRGSGEGVASSDRLFIDGPLDSVTFEITGDAGESLIVRNAQGQSVTIVNQWNRDNGIEFFDFADGTSLTAQEVNARLLSGTAGVDHINGTNGDDLIDGHGGADVLSGNYGSDTYAFNRGYGTLTISDPMGLNRIKFGDDIVQNDISIDRRSDGLLISILGTSDSILVQGGRSYQDAMLQFASGSISVTDLILALSDPNQLPVDGVIRGTSKTDFGVDGTEGNDIIDGLGGDEWLSGHEGDDTYLFGGSGEKEIMEDDGFDVIRLASELTFDKFIFLPGMITFEGSDGYVQIDNWWQSDGTLYTGRSWEQVEGLIFADGRTFSLVSDKILAGGDGNDILFNFGSLSESFTPGKGNDRIFASETSGTKTVVLGHDFGHDVLYPGANFRLDLTAFTLDSSAAMRRDGDDLIVSTNNGANDIRVKRVFEFVTSGFAQSTVLFSGGVTLTMANVIQRITVATAGNDILFGRTSLDGGAGDDILIGDRLVNNYFFGKGYGHDVIKERTTNSSEYSVQDTLTMIGLNRSDVTIARDPADAKSILITIKETGETVRLDGTPLDDFRYLEPEDNYNPNGADDFGAHWVERIVFANGEVLSQKQIEQMLLDAEATSGDDVIELFGAPWRASVDGTFVDGGAGNDIYHSDYATANIRWSASSGSDRLISTAGFYRDCKVKLNGIQAKDVLVTVEQRDGEPHFILHAHDGSELAIPGIGRDLYIIAEDGTQYLVRQAGPLIENKVATDGDDWMRGKITGTWTTFRPSDAYSDVFDGGKGNDVIAGYGASDTVFFGRGDGQDVLLDSIVMGPNNDKPQTYTIAFKSGVAREDVTIAWMTDGSGNLKISINGTEDSIIMSPHNFVALTFFDGRKVRTTDVGDGAEIINLKALRPAATPGNDVLFVDANQTIDGGAGDDVIYHLTETNSWNGRATVMFGRGSGNDIFSNTTAVPEYDFGYLLNNQTNHTVHLKGIASLDEVRLIKSGADLIIEIKDTGERLTIKNQLLHELSNDSVDMPVSSINLDSGDSFYFPWLQDLIVGDDYAGDDVISSDVAGGVLDGGAGNDILKGSTGDDSYVLGRGYDEDKIVDAGGASDRLLFQDGVAATDVVFTRTGTNGADLLIEVLGDDRLTMTVSGQFDSGNSRIESFVFSSGETLSWANVQQMILGNLGTSADDNITGFDSDDQLSGGSGNDQLAGLGGNDEFNGGTGRDLAIFRGSSSEYIVTTVHGITTVQDLVAGRDGTDRLMSIEDLRFLGDAGGVELTPANHAPVAGQGVVATAEDGEIIISRADIMALASDVDGDALTLTVGSAVHGQVWLDRDGNVHFRPQAQFSGEGGFEYTVKDANGGSATAHFRVDIAATNDAPIVTGQMPDITVDEDGAISFAIPQTLFTDLDGNALTIDLRLANGDALPDWLTFESGMVTGQPPANFNGALSLAVVASDGQLSTSAGFSLVVQPRNDAPAYVGPSLDQLIETGQHIDIAIGSDLFNDPDGDPLSLDVFQSSGDPLPGWLTYANGHLIGEVPAGFDGSLGISIRATDGSRSIVSHFALSVAENAAPEIGVPLTDVSIAEDTPIDIMLPADAFIDADNDALAFTATLGDGSPLPGWLTLEGTRLHGTPPANFNGALNILVTASDGSATVSNGFELNILPVNDAPSVSGTLAPVSAGRGEEIEVAINPAIFSDADGDPLSFSVRMVDGSALPSWLSFASGMLIGTVPETASGEYHLSVVASDGSAQASAPLNLTIISGNEPPVAVDDATFITVRGQPLHIAAADLLANDHDPDNDPLSVVAVDGASHGTIEIGADGTIIYTPDGGFMGSDTFTYTLSDGQTVGEATVSVRVDDPFASWSQGTSASEKLFGNLNSSNRISGLAGDDHLKGGHEQDWLAGGAGNDNLNGLNGDDYLWGMEGNDFLEGSSGSDTAYYFGTMSSYSLTTSNGVLSITDTRPDFDGDDGTDILSNIEKLSFKGGTILSIASPIILDLNGDGVQTVAASKSKARFDMNGDGKKDDTSWIGSSDGFLFLDRDHNGTLSGIGEMSFTADLAGAKSDLEGLAAFDSNGDGKLSAEDARFGEFKVWRDRNGDGSVDRGEVLSLADVSLKSISLAGTANNSTVALGGVAVLNSGSWTRTDGTTMQLADAAMTYFSGDAPHHGWLSSLFEHIREAGLVDGERGFQAWARQAGPFADPARMLELGGDEPMGQQDWLYSSQPVEGDEAPFGTTLAAMAQDIASFGSTSSSRIELRPPVREGNVDFFA